MSVIVTVPNPVLRQVTKRVFKADKKLQAIIEDMRKTLLAAKNPEGVGLAAPQIGLPLRLFLIRPDPKKPPLVFINPEITNFSQRQQTPEGKHGVYEGCLSIPHHYAPLRRAMSVTVTYQDEHLEPHAEVFSDFPAHVIQHEMDHLNGILFIDRVLEQNSKLFKVEGKDWQEIVL